MTQNEKNAGKKDAQTIFQSCPFCREAIPSAKGALRHLVERMLQNDANAFATMARIFFMATLFTKTSLEASTTGFGQPNLELPLHAVPSHLFIRAVPQRRPWTRRGPLYLNKPVQ